jgi:hypothetical protein
MTAMRAYGTHGGERHAAGKRGACIRSAHRLAASAFARARLECARRADLFFFFFLSDRLARLTGSRLSLHSESTHQLTRRAASPPPQPLSLSCYPLPSCLLRTSSQATLNGARVRNTCLYCTGEPGTRGIESVAGVREGLGI